MLLVADRLKNCQPFPRTLHTLTRRVRLVTLRTRLPLSTLGRYQSNVKLISSPGIAPHRRESPVSRTILDVDDELLAEAGKILGTTTKRATVNAALKAIVDREKRRQFADWLKSGGLPELTGPVEATEPDAA